MAQSAPPKPAGQKTMYIVVFHRGVNPASEANALRVTPDYVYRFALNGIAAKMNASELSRAEQDPAVLFITDDDNNPVFPAPSVTAATSSAASGSGFSPGDDGTPVGAISPDAAAAMAPSKIVKVTKIPQIDSFGFDRVGGLNTPWIHMDNIDDHINSDIAILDSGVFPNDDLRLAGGVDCVNDNGNFSDPEGHGTQVAGIVAMIDNNWAGIGIAPGARIWAVRVLNKELIGEDSNVLCGLDWVAQHADTIKVANMSFSESGFADDGNCGLIDHDPLHLAVCGVYARGVVLVAGAGNDFADSSNYIPASYSEVIDVSGISDSDGLPGGLGGTNCAGFADDVFAPFSDWGAAVDIAAPAVCIPSTWIHDGFFRDSGTSFAAPFITGAAALYRVHHPFASPAQVRRAIIDARDPAPFPGDPDGIGEGILDLANLR